MKKFLLILLSILTFWGAKSYASHVPGGQLSYKYISTTGINRVYEVTLVLYGDCAGGAFSSFATTQWAEIKLYKNNIQVGIQNIPVVPAESNILISPVCATQINSTTCTSGGTLVGIKKFTYRMNFTLADTSSNWIWAFTGNTNSSSAGRSSVVDNATNLGTFHINAMLNNSTGENDSPNFTSDPTPFFCANIPASFGLGAVDPNGDNMAYSLTPALNDDLGNATITYNIAPYTFLAPVPAVAGTFSFNPASGVTDFTPSMGNFEAVVVNTVTETRNGVVVGRSSREMLFVFLANCSNTAPSTPIGGVNNGEMLPGTSSSVEFKACEAQQVSFSYTVSPIDPQGDNITITGTNIPAGALLNITNNGTPAPSLTFEWNLAAVPAGTYQFFITYKDDGCPLSSVKTVSYTVFVQAFNGNFTTGFQEPCRDDSNGFAFINPDPLDTALYMYTWTDPAFNVLQATPSLQAVGDTLNNLIPGVYLVEAENYRGCKRKFNVMVDSSTYHAYFEADTIACVNSTVAFNPNFNNSDFVQWHWDFGNGTSSNVQDPIVSYPVPGVYTIKLTATNYIGCVDSFEQQIEIFAIATPDFEFDKTSICVGQKVNIIPNYGPNATKVYWDFGDGGNLNTATVPNLNYTFSTPGVFSVNMKTSYKACPDVSFNRTITVNDFPNVDLGYDTGICYQGSPILLQNLMATSAADIYSWNTGATTASISATQPGVYALTITRNDCATTDSVNVKKDCYVNIPNAFAPGAGNDGYFLPRSILTQGTTRFNMSIYNRWGEKVFQTSNPDGRGWDGTYNGVAQPQGVYIYKIEVTYKDGRDEKYSGDVTLVR